MKEPNWINELRTVLKTEDNYIEPNEPNWIGDLRQITANLERGDERYTPLQGSGGVRETVSGLPIEPIIDKKADQPLLHQALAKPRLDYDKDLDLQILLDKGYTKPQLDLMHDIYLKEKHSFRGGQAIGGTIGGLAGGALPNILFPAALGTPEEKVTVPLGRKAGQLVAAGLGAGSVGAVGEGIQIGAQEHRWPTYDELMDAGKEEFLYEVGGRMIWGAGRIARGSLPMIGTKKPRLDDNLIREFTEKVHGVLPPSAQDARVLVELGESISRGSFVSSKMFKDMDRLTQARILLFADDIVEEVAERFTKNPTEAGEMLLEMITRPGISIDIAEKGTKLKMFDDLVRPLYTKIDEATKVATISTNPLKTFAKELLEKDKRLKGLFLSPAGRNRFTKIMSLDEYVKYEDMSELRSSFLGDIRKFSRDADKSQGLVKKASSIIDDSMFGQEATKNLSEETQRLIRNVNAIYKSGSQIFDTTFAYKVAKKLSTRPETAPKLLYTKDFNKIRSLKRALLQDAMGKSDPKGKRVWDSLRQQFLADIVEKSSTGTELSMKLSASRFDRLLHGIGKKSMKEIFNVKELSRIQKIVKLVDATQQGSRLGEGASLFSKSLQIGGATAAIYNIREGDEIGATGYGALAISPLAFATLARHPRYHKILIAGFKNKSSAALAPIGARLIRALRQIKADESQKETQGLRNLRTLLAKPQYPTMKEQRGFGGRGF